MRRRYSLIIPGQLFTTRPDGVRYQLVQPLCQTEPRSRSCTSRSKALWTLSRTSSTTPGRRTICCTAPTTQFIWLSSMWMIEPAPRLVFGPYMMKRLGKPLTLSPR